MILTIMYYANWHTNVLYLDNCFPLFSLIFLSFSPTVPNKPGRFPRPRTQDKHKVAHPTNASSQIDDDAAEQDARAAVSKGNAEADVKKPTPSSSTTPAKTSVSAAAVLAPSAASAAVFSPSSPPSSPSSSASASPLGSATGSPTSLVESAGPTTLTPAKATAAGTQTAAPMPSSLSSGASGLSGSWPIKLVKSVKGVVALAALQGREL